MKSILTANWRQKCRHFWSVLLKYLKRGLIFPLVLLIKCYQICISPFTPPSCRFTPTCSQYALGALRKHGPLKGLYLAVWRFLRCNPWGGSGYDPVP
ncbi:MAG: membrane protein insertion efficiency factor YidD [Bacteroidales bacterium]